MNEPAGSARYSQAVLPSDSAKSDLVSDRDVAMLMWKRRDVVEKWQVLESDARGVNPGQTLFVV